MKPKNIAPEFVVMLVSGMMGVPAVIAIWMKLVINQNEMLFLAFLVLVAIMAFTLAAIVWTIRLAVRKGMESLQARGLIPPED